MTIKHLFRSGNDCIVYIPDQLPDGFGLTHTEWENFPPSTEDLREWLEDVYPGKVIPQLEAVARQTRGPGRLMNVAPGVWVWQGADDRDPDVGGSKKN